ncbi:MAG: efflux RND transporter periplasmic adaptor subunit, partial [Terriglobia bacterium]
QAQAAYQTATQVSVPEQMQSAQLSAEEARQAMDAAQKVYTSRQTLYRQGAIARNLLDQSHVAYVQASNQYQIAETHIKALQAGGHAQLLKSASAQLASANAAYDAAEAQLGYSEIRSSIDGVVASTPLYPGEMASAGTPLVVVMNVSKIIARGRVSPQQAAELQVGDPGTVYPSSSTTEGVDGHVSVVSPSLDPNSTTVEVWVEAANRDDELKPGSTVDVKMVAESVKNAVVVPSAAILTDSDGKTTVMVVDQDNTAHQTPVRLGIREGDNVQVLSGVHEGERIVTEGAYGLPDGTKVKY